MTYLARWDEKLSNQTIIFTSSSNSYTPRCARLPFSWFAGAVVLTWFVHGSTEERE